METDADKKIKLWILEKKTNWKQLSTLVILHLLCRSTGTVNHGQKEEQTVGEVILIEISTL